RPPAELLHLRRGLADRARQPRVGLDGLGGGDDVAALSRERERDVLADAAGGAGDEGHAAGEFHAAKTTRTPRSFRAVLRSLGKCGGHECARRRNGSVRRWFAERWAA